MDLDPDHRPYCLHGEEADGMWMQELASAAEESKRRGWLMVKLHVRIGGLVRRAAGEWLRMLDRDMETVEGC